MTDLDDISFKDIEARLKQTRHVIALAKADLMNGKFQPLSHLKDDVNAICNEAVALSTDEAKKLLPQIADMIDELEYLAKALEEYQKEMKAKLQ